MAFYKVGISKSGDRLRLRLYFGGPSDHARLFRTITRQRRMLSPQIEHWCGSSRTSSPASMTMTARPSVTAVPSSKAPSNNLLLLSSTTCMSHVSTTVRIPRCCMNASVVARLFACRYVYGGWGVGRRWPSRSPYPRVPDYATKLISHEPTPGRSILAFV